MKFFISVYTVVILFTLTSCSNNNENEVSNEKIYYSSEFYGNYDVLACESYNCRLTLTESGTKVTDIYGNTFNWKYTNYIETLEDIGNNVFKTTFDNGNVMYLSKLLKNRTITGRVATQSSNLAPARSIPIGGVDAILSQFGNKDKEINVKTDGTFEINNVENVPSTIKIDTVTIPVKHIENQNNDTGIITLTDQPHNFKSELTLNKKYLFSQLEYSATIRVRNLTNTRVNGVNVLVNAGSNISMNQAFSQGTLEPNGYLDVPFSFYTHDISNEVDKIEFDITISDSSANEWHDNLSYTLYKDSIYIDVCYTGSQNATIHTTITNRILGNIQHGVICGGIDLPYMSGESYEIVVGNRDIGNESAYFISYGVDLHPSWGAQILSSVHEPDNIPSKATTIGYGEVVEGYISVDDIDFYRIDMN